MTPAPAFAILGLPNQPGSEPMRAVLIHAPQPDRAHVQSGYHGFVRDAALLIPGVHRMGYDSWLIPDAAYQALEAPLLGLGQRHAACFATIEVEIMSPWREHP